MEDCGDFDTSIGTDDMKNGIKAIENWCKKAFWSSRNLSSKLLEVGEKENIKSTSAWYKGVD